MDKIVLNGMQFYGYHGVLPEEKKVGQPFIVSVELPFDLTAAGVSDDLKDTISYAEVYGEVKKIVEEKQFNLIEALAHDIAITLLQKYDIPRVRVIIDKPQAPVGGGILAARVEILREENDEFKLGLLKFGE